MKKGIHPETRLVVFRDASEHGGLFVIKTTAVGKNKETFKIGKESLELDVVNISVSSKTHPFCSGSFGTLSDTDNKIKDFTGKYGLFT
ncbi:MAG: 50S ribosomal protein L31 [Chlamydiia bacterium]|nr:50S ribosomal protein L31 [Chlamydiia bacterium]